MCPSGLTELSPDYKSQSLVRDSALNSPMWEPAQFKATIDRAWGTDQAAGFYTQLLGLTLFLVKVLQ